MRGHRFAMPSRYACTFKEALVLATGSPLSIRDVSAGVPDDGAAAWADDLSFAPSAPAQTSSPARPRQAAAAKPKPTAKAAPTANARPTATQAAYHSSWPIRRANRRRQRRAKSCPSTAGRRSRSATAMSRPTRCFRWSRTRFNPDRNHRADVADPRLLHGQCVTGDDDE